MTNPLPDWVQRLKDELASMQGGGRRQEFLQANGQAVARALIGASVDSVGRRSGAGSCVVVNMASAHVLSFTAQGASYKNCYDLDRERVGRAPPKASPKRVAVDTALESLHHRSKENIYFAAVELNGCGVGFYGDCCLVLREEAVTNETLVLDRNSYDLVRDPLQAYVVRYAKVKKVTIEDARVWLATHYAGILNRDLAAMAAIKVLSARRPAERLLTTAMISDGVLEDEDYLEVLVEKTFSIADVREVRLSPAEVSMDERIRSRSIYGRAPSSAEMLWRSRRRQAEGRFEAIGVPVRVVTSTGRRKG